MTKETKETILSVLRTVLTFAGTYFVGQKIFNHTLDQNTWQLFLSAFVALASSVWGFFDKSVTLEQAESALRSLFIIVGGFLVSAGVTNQDTLNSIWGLIISLIPIIQSIISKQKMKQIQSGKILPSDSGKAVNKQ